MKDSKLNTDTFDQKYKELLDQLQTIRMAITDNFNTILATDNYIEKYFPLNMQNLISENMLSILNRPLFKSNRKLLELKEDEMEQLKKYQKFRKVESRIITNFHKKIIDDDGNPTLAKRQYGLKGYRQVLINKERSEYEMKAMYQDTLPLEESDSEYEDPDIFTSKDLRHNLKFKRHVKRFTGSRPNQKELEQGYEHHRKEHNDCDRNGSNNSKIETVPNQ